MIRQTLEAAFQQSGALLEQPRSDFDLNPDKSFIPPAELRAAAVLIPIVDHPGEPTILLTRRSNSLTKHAGQISFPGGRVDPTDRDAVAAALRETREETAIPSDHVTVFGQLAPYRTVTKYEITPVVAALSPGFTAVAEPAEVEEIFEVPLSFILDRSNHQKQSADYKGQTRYFYTMPYGRHYIWGATAAMLINLVDVLDPVRKKGLCA